MVVVSLMERVALEDMDSVRGRGRASFGSIGEGGGGGSSGYRSYSMVECIVI